MEIPSQIAPQPQVLGMNEHSSRRAHSFEELPQPMFEERLNLFTSDAGSKVKDSLWKFFQREFAIYKKN